MRLDCVLFLGLGLATLSLAQQADTPYPVLIPRSSEAREAIRKADRHIILNVVVADHLGKPVLSLASEITKQVTESAAYYVVSYESKPGYKVDEYHALEIQVNRPGVNTRTNTGYYAEP